MNELLKIFNCPRGYSIYHGARVKEVLVHGIAYAHKHFTKTPSHIITVAPDAAFNEFINIVNFYNISTVHKTDTLDFTSELIPNMAVAFVPMRNGKTGQKYHVENAVTSAHAKNSPVVYDIEEFNGIFIVDITTTNVDCITFTIDDSSYIVIRDDFIDGYKIRKYIEYYLEKTIHIHIKLEKVSMENARGYLKTLEINQKNMISKISATENISIASYKDLSERSEEKYDLVLYYGAEFYSDYLIIKYASNEFADQSFKELHGKFLVKLNENYLWIHISRKYTNDDLTKIVNLITSSIKCKKMQRKI